MTLGKASTIMLLGLYLSITNLNRFAITTEPDKINVYYSSIAATSITTWVPKETRIYKKYGLDVSIIYVAETQTITTLISGDTQIVQSSSTTTTLSRLSNSDLTVIATTINVIPMSLVTTSNIATTQDLKGKTFDVSRFGSLTDLRLKKTVTELKLDPNKDIKMIQTSSVPKNLLFMQQGIIKSTLISSPTLERTKKLDYKEFMNLTNLKYHYPRTTLVTTNTFIRNRPQTLNRFLKATLEKIKYTKANPDFTVRILKQYTQNTDTKLLTSTFKNYVLGYIRDMPTVTLPEMEAVIEDIATRNPKAKGIDARQFYDPAPLKQLAKENFIKELYPHQYFTRSSVQDAPNHGIILTRS